MKGALANDKTEEIMTVSAFARYLHCNRHTLYRLLKRKEIPAFKIGSDWRFSRSAIDEWIAGLRVTNPLLTRGSGRKRGTKA